MEDNSSLLLQFYEHLEKEYKETYDLLEPYFKEVEARLDSGKNSYGVGTPRDQILLDKLQTVANLVTQLKSYDNLEQLKNTLIEKRNNYQKENNIRSIEQQLRYIEEWLNQRDKENNATKNSRKH